MLQVLTEAHNYAPLTLLVNGTHDISGNLSAQTTTASEIWLVAAEPGATLSGVLKIYDGAPPIHIKGFELTAHIDVEAPAPLEISDCKFRRAVSSRRRLGGNHNGIYVINVSTNITNTTFAASLGAMALMVRSGHTTITNCDFEDFDDCAIYVEGGTLAIADSEFRGNNNGIFVTNGSTSIANTTFAASLGTALHVIGGDVVLKDQTALLNNHIDLNITHDSARVRYELPAPLGRYAFIQDGSGNYSFEPGEHRGDFPFACSAGVVGDSSAAQNQSNPGCSRVCPGGYYCRAGTIRPTVCPVSSYCAAGSSAPTACKPGTVGRKEGLQSDGDCEACPVGSWCSAGLVIPCGNNTFQPEISQTYAGACQQCPKFAESGESSASVEDCKCQEAYYDSATDGVSCEPCPIGSSCNGPGNTLARLPLLPGYWRTHNTSVDLRRCPDASSPNTTACANMNRVLCKPWTTGPYCRVCNVTDGSRYFDVDQSACVECGSVEATSFAAHMSAVLGVLCLLCWCGWKRPYKYLRNLGHRALPRIRAPLKQMVSFYQVDSCDVQACARLFSSLTPFSPTCSFTDCDEH